jgi:hypothetical protein
MASTPHARRLAALAERDQYAAMELWRGGLATHSALVSRSDELEPRVQVSFDDEARWQQYVPVRLPGTVCVQERVPPGAAAVLLSRYHAFPDLVLAVDVDEKRMVDAIDGRRSIADIAGNTAVGDRLRRARSLFERLFDYDQVVFDISIRLEV